MSTSINNKNLEAHYSSNTKVERPKISAADVPKVLPGKPIYTDSEANKRIKVLNQEIYTKTQKEKKKDIKNFTLGMGGIITAIAAAIGLKSIFK